MASAMRVFRKFRASDGRIKAVTASGVLALVAVIAMLVGVLPVFATHGFPDDETDEGVHPEEVQYGGGAGACDFEEVDSDAEFELHINNPANEVFEGPDGTKVEITLDEDDPRIFGYEFLGQGDDPAVMAAYDVVVNGGPHNLWYDNDGQVETLQKDGNLHAPFKKSGELNNLSHINICYDIQATLFKCGVEESALRFGEQGDFTEAGATIFSVNGITEGEKCKKLGLFFIEGGETTLDFGTGDGVVEGRADFKKQFDGGAAITPLRYDGGPAEDFEEVPWCTIGDADADEFGNFVSGYPELPTEPSGHTACKVYEEENADGFQFTVVYFEFEDPQFR